MILRPEPGPISDFQDYTLVAVIAVATHLLSPHTGDHHHFLAALAQRFSQDLTALHQVCPLQQAGLSGERLSCNMPVLTAHHRSDNDSTDDANVEGSHCRTIPVANMGLFMTLMPLLRSVASCVWRGLDVGWAFRLCMICRCLSTSWPQ